MLYVDGSVSASGDGTSWETALKSIQEGIDSATDGDSVLVAEGTYVENIHFHGKNITLTSTDPLDPEVVDKTVIAGNQAGSVVRLNGTEDESCVLSGFSIGGGASEDGGGICGGHWDSRTHATIQRNVIASNIASESGGGLAYCDGIIEKNTILGNEAYLGGGLSTCGGVIQNNTIVWNSAEFGGGLCGWDGNLAAKELYGAIIRNNIISGNWAEVYGGGLSYYDGVIENNLICENVAGSGGGLAYCGPVIQNNTVFGNIAFRDGGGFYYCGSIIRNCIIWGNEAREMGDQLHDSTVPTYCCIQNWAAAGTGNISGDPRLIDPDGPDDKYWTYEDNDYRLQPDSPCINAGVNYYWFSWPQRDLHGNCRLVGDRVDIGCCEFGSGPDRDGDLLSDSYELRHGPHFMNEDADGDGLRDGLEILRGSDPLEKTAPSIIHVPSEMLLVQAAVCLAVSGDKIIVSPGTYRENVHFCGEDIMLQSIDPENGEVVDSTVLDGGGEGPVVTFTGRETNACILSGLTITGGAAKRGGGVLSVAHLGHRTRAIIEKNVITGNSAFHGGGLAHCGGIIQNNIVTQNWAEAEGGGLAFCDATVQDNIISENSAGLWGGGLSRCYGSIRNNVVWRNIAAREGGGLALCGRRIQNCIIWGNSPVRQLDSPGEPTHCCIQFWSGEGQGNIAEKPEFVDAENGDFRLSRHSPCIDAGFNDLDLPLTDMAGMHRIMFGGRSFTVDMGAYEYYIIRLQPGPGPEQTNLTWGSLADKSYSIFYSDDLVTWQLAVDEFPSDGNTTTSWIDDGSTTGVPPSLAPRRFYRIQENP